MKWSVQIRLLNIKYLYLHTEAKGCTYCFFYISNSKGGKLFFTLYKKKGKMII